MPALALLRRIARLSALVVVCLALTSCQGIQSSLDPAGQEAQSIANLFWWMTAGGAIVFLSVISLAFYASRTRPEPVSQRAAHRLILIGAISPAVVLGALLIYGLAILPGMLARPAEGSLRISVYGEQWWWRVRYEPKGQPAFELANQVRLPVGEPVEFILHSNNVIHSFWIPSLGGKMDMIPGRVNRLTLHPTRTGRFRGACAEFCGIGHAKMAFDTTVVTGDEFRRWLAEHAAAAPAQGLQ